MYISTKPIFWVDCKGSIGDGRNEEMSEKSVLKLMGYSVSKQSYDFLAKYSKLRIAEQCSYFQK